MVDYNKMSVDALRKETTKRGLPQRVNGKRYTKEKLVAQLEAYDKRYGAEDKADSDAGAGVGQQDSEKDYTTPIIDDLSDDSTEDEGIHADDVETLKTANKRDVEEINDYIYSNNKMLSILDCKEAGIISRLETLGDGYLPDKEHRERTELKRELKNVQLDKLIVKYSYPRSDWFYENKIKVGAFVAYVSIVRQIEVNGKLIDIRKLRTAKITGVNRAKRKVIVNTILGDKTMLDYTDILYLKETVNDWFPQDIRRILKGQRTEKGKELINEKIRID